MRRLVPLLMAASLAFGLGVKPTVAASPSGGKVGPANGSSTKVDFGPVGGVNTGGTPEPNVACSPGVCDSFNLDVFLPQKDLVFYATHTATLFIHYTWDAQASTDLDVFAVDPNGGVSGPGSPDTMDTGPNFEDLRVLDPPSGRWLIDSVGGIAPVPTAAHAVISLTYKPRAPLSQLPRATDPHFANYAATGQGRDILQRPNAGEPSIGADWKSGAIMYMAGTQVWRITFNDAKNPATATWTDVTPPALKVVSEDSVLFTDPQTNRTFAAGLYLACNFAAFTDNDGASWTPSEGCGPPAGPDHPTVGGGRYAPGGSSTNSYPHAIYDCSQYLVSSGKTINASCALSRDGGMTFGSPPTMIWDGTCDAIHGHIRVGPDGTAYVPNNSCSGHIAVGVSRDNDKTWTVRAVPDSKSPPSGQDPSVAIDAANNVYLGYVDASGHPKVAVSHDDGAHWSKSADVSQFRDPGESEGGLAHGINNTEFAEVIAGSAGRAAFAFLGTGTGGNDQADAFRGVWYMFVSYTYDAGRTWHTVNATPNNPVQRGCISNGGVVRPTPCRNLLDFNDITVDNHGRVLVAYTDGCTTNGGYSCDKTNRVDTSGCVASEGSPVYSTPTCTYGRLSSVLRQTCGLGLLAKFDGDLPSCSGTTASNVLAKRIARAPTPLPATGLGSGDVVGGGLMLLALACIVARRRILPA